MTRQTRRKLAAASQCVAEALENRTLLTTLHGGDTFVYLGQGTVYEPFTPVWQTIKLFGSQSFQAEVIGGDVQGDNTALLENLPGELNGNPVNGGFALAPGTTPVGTLPLDLQSIAVDPTSGIIYGITIDQGMRTFPLATTPPTTTTVTYNYVNLVTIDPTTGNVTQVTTGSTANPTGGIQDAILAGDGIQVGPTNTMLVTGVPAITFVGGMMYLAASIGGGGGGNESLYSLDPNNPTAVGAIPGNFGGNTVTALSAVTSRTGVVGLFGTSANSVFQVNLGNSNNITNQITPTVDGPISGIIQNADGQILISTNTGGATSELYWINPIATAADKNTGNDAVDFGPMPTTVITNDAVQTVGTAGATPGSLTYDPTTNTIFGMDFGSRQLLTVSQTNRTRNLSIYQIYIASSDPTSSIFTSQSNAPGDEAGNGWMTPYGTGIASGINVNDAQTGDTINVASPAGSGTALIGDLTRHLVPNTTGDADFPVTTGVVPTDPNTGNSPFTDAPYTPGTTVTTGVVGAPGTSLGSLDVSGPIFGAVDLAGSIDTLYAGWLLTGDTNGEHGTNDVTDPGNFTVGGDIRNLLVADSIGTDSDSALNLPTYVTGFDMHVGGTIGLVKTFDSLIGNINDAQSPTAPNLTTNQQETEVRTVGANNPWGAGILGNTTAFYNDTFATDQQLGALPTSQGAAPSAVVVDGDLQADPTNLDFVDYYGVPLLAGQTITVQLVQLIPPPLVIDVGVFNPDGDLVATDYSQVDMSQTQQLQFRITTDRPGVWRFAIAGTGDAMFTDAGGQVVGDTPYELTVQNVGDTAIGAIVAVNNIFDNVDPANDEPGFGTQVGNLGAIEAGNDFFSSTAGDTINVQTGSLIDVDAGNIGLNQIPFEDPEIEVPVGNVGLVSATATSGVLIFNYPLLGLPPAIGGDYQVVSATGNMLVKLVADGSIGVIRGQETIGIIAGNPIGPSAYSVNADNSTTPGNIDLIDFTGNFGDIMNGGPQITTGPEGNVGYLRVGGTVYRDATFGSGVPESTLYQPGESVTLTDDSGAQVTITPTGTPSIPATGGPGSNDTSGSTVNPALPQLTIIAYGIEGSGGVAICNVTSTGGVTLTGSGQQTGQTVQIGTIDAQGLGQTINQLVVAPSKTVQPVQPSAPGSTSGTTTTTGGTTTGTGGTTTATTTAPTFYTAPDTAGPLNRTLPLPNPPILNPNSASPLNVILTGSARMDVFEVDGGLFSSITDSTGGDIVNVKAQSIGTLSSNGQIGLTQNHTGAALNGIAVVANSFPLIDVHNAITVGVAGGVTPGGAGPLNPITTTIVTNGVTTTTTTATVTTPAIVSAAVLGIATIIAAHGIGNINAVGNGTATASIGTIQGSILGPVYATGSIYSVVLGSGGIAYYGNGAVAEAGVYAVGQIGLVTSNVPADIRGAIASQTGITGIDLKGGSIIDAAIENVTNLDMTVQLPIVKTVVTTITPVTNPVLNLGNVIVEGNGGIIGTSIGADHIGHIDVHHGFGILDSTITTLGNGTLAGILTDGYGLRGLDFNGSTVGSIVAAGSGINVSTQVYSADVRYSEIDAFDPYTGFAPNLLTDIDLTTGATAQTPQVPAFGPLGDDGNMGTDTGIISNCDFVGNRNLSSVSAYQIRATDPVLAPTTFNFANSIGTITTKSNDDGLAVITGKLTTFKPGGNIDNLTFQIAGPIRSLNIAGNVTSNSIISASGKNGNIGTLRVGGTMQGSITAARQITSATIGGNLTGTVSAKQINNLKVVGQLNGGNLDIEGNVNNLTFVGDLGLPSETLTIHGSVHSLKIGGNLNADIAVQGNLGTLQVGQSVIAGTLTDVDGILNNLIINGDLQANATIEATLIRHQKIKGLNQGTIIGAA